MIASLSKVLLRCVQTEFSEVTSNMPGSPTNVHQMSIDLIGLCNCECVLQAFLKQLSRHNSFDSNHAQPGPAPEHRIPSWPPAGPKSAATPPKKVWATFSQPLDLLALRLCRSSPHGWGRNNDCHMHERAFAMTPKYCCCCCLTVKRSNSWHA